VSLIRQVILQDPLDSSRLAGLDSLFKVLVTIDSVHHEIHEGSSFVTSSVDIAMGNGDTLVLSFKTPSGTKRVHMISDFATFAGGYLDIIEGPIWDNQTGILSSITNRKREAIMNSSILLEDSGQAAFTATDNAIFNPTGLSGGTVLHTVYGFGKKDKVAPASGYQTEIILKPDTQYAYRFTSDSASNEGQITLNWYEYSDE